MGRLHGRPLMILEQRSKASFDICKDLLVTEDPLTGGNQILGASIEHLNTQPYKTNSLQCRSLEWIIEDFFSVLTLWFVEYMEFMFQHLGLHSLFEKDKSWLIYLLSLTGSKSHQSVYSFKSYIFCYVHPSSLVLSTLKVMCTCLKEKHRYTKPTWFLFTFDKNRSSWRIILKHKLPAIAHLKKKQTNKQLTSIANGIIQGQGNLIY